jgi:glycosyltransferase involved in cell wall biosynthesis
LIEHYGFNKNKIAVINNPVDRRIENYNHVGRSLDSVSRDTILFVGRLDKQKGLHYLLKSFSKLDTSDVILKLVGKGPLKEELMVLAERLNILDRVYFEGFQSDIIPYYLSSKITVLSSVYEGFPNALIESITLGTPVVAFDCQSGPSEIIKDGENGFLAKYLDVDDLSRKIDKGLKKSWDKDEVMKTALNYNRKVIINKYIKLLQEQ